MHFDRKPDVYGVKKTKIRNKVIKPVTYDDLVFVDDNL